MDVSTLYVEFLRHITQQHSLARQVIEPGEAMFYQEEQVPDVYFIEQGLVKLVFNQLDGKEFIKNFLAENDVSGSLLSAVFGRPSPYSCIGLETTSYYVIPYRLIKQEGERFGQFKEAELRYFHELTAKKEQREYEFLCLNPEQRYRAFKQDFPHLLKRVSQADMARFLGITPVALSRIKSRVLSNLEEVS